MNPFALRERRQILCSRRWFRALKNFSWRYSLPPRCCCYHRSIYWHHSAWTCTCQQCRLCQTRLVRQRAHQLTLTTYLVMIGAGQLLFGPLSDRLGRRPVLLGGGLAYVVARQWASLLRHRLKSFWGFGFFRLVVPRRALFPHLQQYVTFTQVARKVMSFTAYSDPCWPWSRR